MLGPRIEGSLLPRRAHAALALAAWLVTAARPAAAQTPAPAAAPPPPPPPAATAAPTPQPPPTLPVADAVRAYVATRRDVLGRACPATELVSMGELHYVACGASGMWVVRLGADGAANVVAVQDLGGEVVGFFEQGGELWARIMTQRATPILTIAPGTVSVAAPVVAAPGRAQPVSAQGPQGAPLPAQPPRRTWGTVIESSSGSVVVDLGSNEGVRHGSRVAFYVIDRAALSGFEEVPRKRRVAVGVVDTVGAERSRVALGVAEHVDRGTNAELTTDPPSANPLAPPRVGDIWDYGFLARPFLVLDEVGVGAVIDAHVGYRSQDAWHVEGLLAPFSFATAGPGAIAPFAAVITGSYDAPLFEIGLGLGGQSVNSPDFGVEPGNGLSLVQRLRLGARDGLNLEAMSYVALFYSEFEFSSLRATLQIPIGKSWLLLSGGGGTLGAGLGEVGLRVLLTGNGDRDSVFMTTTLGGVNLWEECSDVFCDDEIDYAGPMIGVGFDWRQ